MCCSGADDAAPDCEAEPQGDGGGAGEPAGSTEGDGTNIIYLVLDILKETLYNVWTQGGPGQGNILTSLSFQVLTVLCSAYFLVKAMVWLNKSF